jgi:hypothetical protein
LRLSGDFNPRRDANPAQWLPSAQKAARLDSLEVLTGVYSYRGAQRAWRRHKGKKHAP